MSRFRLPYTSKRGKMVKFILPSNLVERLSKESEKTGLGWHGTAKQLLVNTLSYPKYSKFIEIMKLVKEFEASLLD